jgi:hypothetical protein
MAVSRFFIKDFHLYDDDARIVFELNRVDESGGFGLQGDVFYDCSMLDIEDFIIQEYLPMRELSTLPPILINGIYYPVPQMIAWFVLCDNDVKFDILNTFLKSKEQSVIAQTNAMFSRRAVSVTYTRTLIKDAQLIAA